MLDELLTPLYTSDLGRRGAYIALAVTAFLLLASLIIIPYDGYQSWQTLAKPTVTPTVTKAETDGISASLNQLPSWHLFGANETEQQALPVTSLQLRLIGVIRTVPASKSRVIISSAGGHGKVYKVGDILPEGVTIRSILTDSVILENDGRLEKLPLPRPELGFLGKPKPIIQGE